MLAALWRGSCFATPPLPQEHDVHLQHNTTERADFAYHATSPKALNTTHPTPFLIHEEERGSSPQQERAAGLFAAWFARASQGLLIEKLTASTASFKLRSAKQTRSGKRDQSLAHTSAFGRVGKHTRSQHPGRPPPAPGAEVVEGQRWVPTSRHPSRTRRRLRARAAASTMAAVPCRAGAARWRTRTSRRSSRPGPSLAFSTATAARR